MAKALWVRVPGPEGKPTSVHLTPDYQAGIKARAGTGWRLDYTPVLIKSAAAQLLKSSYDPARDGSWSQAVRALAWRNAG